MLYHLRYILFYLTNYIIMSFLQSILCIIIITIYNITNFYNKDLKIYQLPINIQYQICFYYLF